MICGTPRRHYRPSVLFAPLSHSAGFPEYHTGSQLLNYEGRRSTASRRHIKGAFGSHHTTTNPEKNPRSTGETNYNSSTHKSSAFLRINTRLLLPKWSPWPGLTWNSVVKGNYIASKPTPGLLIKLLSTLNCLKKNWIRWPRRVPNLIFLFTFLQNITLLLA